MSWRFSFVHLLFSDSQEKAEVVIIIIIIIFLCMAHISETLDSTFPIMQHHSLHPLFLVNTRIFLHLSQAVCHKFVASTHSWDKRDENITENITFPHREGKIWHLADCRLSLLWGCWQHHQSDARAGRNGAANRNKSHCRASLCPRSLCLSFPSVSRPTFCGLARGFCDGCSTTFSRFYWINN